MWYLKKRMVKCAHGIFLWIHTPIHFIMCPRVKHLQVQDQTGLCIFRTSFVLASTASVYQCKYVWFVWFGQVVTGPLYFFSLFSLPLALKLALIALFYLPPFSNLVYRYRRPLLVVDVASEVPPLHSSVTLAVAVSVSSWYIFCVGCLRNVFTPHQWP